MKRKRIVWLALLLLSAAGFFWLRYDVVFYNIQVQDQAGTPLKVTATGTFLDAGGKPIVTIPSQPFELGVASIRWWTTDQNFPQRFMTPKDALRAKEVLIEAKGCKTVRLRVDTRSTRHGPSIAPHGSGLRPYDYVEFDPIVRLDCRPD